MCMILYKAGSLLLKSFGDGEDIRDNTDSIFEERYETLLMFDNGVKFFEVLDSDQRFYPSFSITIAGAVRASFKNQKGRAK